MISTRYISFLSGIVIASLTWAFSLYLYSRLSQNTITANPTMLAPGVSIPFKEALQHKYEENKNDKEIRLRDNVIVDHNEKQVVVDKKAYNLKGNKDHRNNDLLLQQPVPVKPAVTLGQGIVF